ncbi:Aspartate-semialdehyde dehydrogenase 2 [Vibrio vulnificus]|nr:Aspartate-semialdehyde dehydrogenase 2 [Vibrio vulnificus]
MSQQYNVAILGATGAVGETILEVLQERKFPVGELYLLASERSEGKTYRFNGKTIYVQNVEEFDWSQAHIGLFSAGGDLSAKWAPIAAEAGKSLTGRKRTSVCSLLAVIFLRNGRLSQQRLVWL